LVVYESVTYEAINPQYLGITKEELEDYLKKHPMPKDPAYSEKDLMGDLLYSSGMYTLPEDIKEETIEYIEELLNTLVY